MKAKITIAASTIAAAIVLAMVTSFGVRLSRNSAMIPKPMHQPFSDWSGPWVTPPLSAGDYWITVDYGNREGGRLDGPLNVKLTDETTGKAVSTEHRLVGAKIRSGDGEHAVAAVFTAIEGHRYKIDVDADQADKLGQNGHRLTVDITGWERENQMVRAWRK